MKEGLHEEKVSSPKGTKGEAENWKGQTSLLARGEGKEKKAEDRTRAATDREKTDHRDEEAEPISPRQLLGPAERVLGIKQDVAEHILDMTLGYLAKYPSVGILRLVEDISKLSKTVPDLVKKLLTV